MRATVCDSEAKPKNPFLNVLRPPAAGAFL